MTAPDACRLATSIRMRITGSRSSIVDAATRKPHRAVIDARERGVFFDIGHGQGSFNWTVAEICAHEGFWPDTISTDIHSGTCEGPAYDMPTVMTRLLHVGMPLNEVIARSTIEPAKCIGWQDRIGTLGVGREADIAVFSVEDVDLALEDCQSQLRKNQTPIVPSSGVARRSRPSDHASEALSES